MRVGLLNVANVCFKTVRRKMKRSALLLFAFVASAPSGSALIINAYDLDSHERFSNDAGFIGNPHDWSGISGSCRATMVSDRFFLSSNHAHPGVGGNISFFHTNDSGGTSETHQIAAGARIRNTDLWLGRLDTSVSSFVKKYSVPNISSTNVIGTEVLVVGRNNNAEAPSPNNLFGRNVVDDFFADITISGEEAGTGVGDIILYDFDTGAGGLGTDESRVQGGDSGSPVFAIANGDPAMLGIHWLLASEDGVFSSGDTFISSYISDINTEMAGFGESLTVVSVPEPSAALRFSTLALAGLCRRTRRRVSGRTLL